ncbi:putative nuclease HARBI1 [Camellia sinensis]|uniref:putative nuclease HARBI1 n=1 Tax=Camellia sinensis TaxID=4442 RepID=UPI001036214E|nr:putative nuclease HARBI1 [Camellia sinensis]
MNNLTKVILNGDFDESLSSDDDIIMMQLFTAQQQRLQTLSLNQQTKRVGSTRGCRYINLSYTIFNKVNEYFIQTRDATGALGLSGVEKMTEALRILQYGCLLMLRLLQEGEQRGFPGMLGSLDCMHWRWDKCPSAQAGAYTGHYHKSTVVLEAVASYNLWIWHAFFGMPGSLNDITVLDKSLLFAELTRGRAPAANYTINNHAYTMWYYLTDVIYPRWATIVKITSQPQGTKRQLFARMQEPCRKDVERAFEVLQARFNIVTVPARGWSDKDLYYIMKTCIILHNMIIEEQRDIPENERSAAQLETDT